VTTTDGGRGKVEAVVANWFPRFLANGLDYLDVRRILDAVDEWDDWAPAWTARADDYEALGRQALADGHRVTAAEHLRRAALTLQFAQFVLTDDPTARQALMARQAELYAAAAPLLDPPARPVRVPHPAGEVVGYLRVPAGVPRPGLVLLVPGLESTKEQFSTYEPFFLRRGVATLSVEGPGQGEGALTAPFRSASYATAMAAVATYVRALTDVDGDRVVVLGTSFGGYLALRHAGLFAGVRGVVDIAGPYDLADFAGLQPVTQHGFASFVGVADPAAAEPLLRDVTLDGVLVPTGPPVLVVHGDRDTIIAVGHAHRIAARLGPRAQLRLEPDGNHSCNNLATVVRPFVADWVADRLSEPLSEPLSDRQPDRPTEPSQETP
jgi:2,6-dihydroxypseudooxynicotine hydrolase